MAILLYDALAGIERRICRNVHIDLSVAVLVQTRRPAHAIQAVPNRLARSRGCDYRPTPRRPTRLRLRHDRHVLTDIVTGAHRAIVVRREVRIARDRMRMLLGVRSNAFLLSRAVRASCKPLRNRYWTVPHRTKLGVSLLHIVTDEGLCAAGAERDCRVTCCGSAAVDTATLNGGSQLAPPSLA